MPTPSLVAPPQDDLERLSVEAAPHAEPPNEYDEQMASAHLVASLVADAERALAAVLMSSRAALAILQPGQRVVSSTSFRRHLLNLSAWELLFRSLDHPPSSPSSGGVRSVDSRLPRRAELCTEVATPWLGNPRSSSAKRAPGVTSTSSLGDDRLDDACCRPHWTHRSASPHRAVFSSARSFGGQRARAGGGADVARAARGDFSYYGRVCSQ